MSFWLDPRTVASCYSDSRVTVGFIHRLFQLFVNCAKIGKIKSKSSSITCCNSSIAVGALVHAIVKEVSEGVVKHVINN